MPQKYRLTNNSYVIRNADNASIPNDLGNMDRVEYNTWLAQGNTPDPFVPPVVSPTDAALQQLQINDDFMFRALELLIDVLLAKGTIVAADFPPAVRTLYQARKALRVSAGLP